MKCGELTDDLLLDYADWRLTPPERDSVGRHLDSCRSCQDRRDEVELMSGALKLATETPPKALLSSLKAPPFREIPENPPTLRTWIYAFSGIAALVVLAFLTYLLLPISPGTGIPQIVHQVTPPAPIVLTEPPAKPDPDPPLLPAIVKTERPTPPPPPKALPPAKKEEAPVRTPPPPAPPRLAGDLNGDGRVDIADARFLQQKIISGTPVALEADLNGDGVVDIADVRHIVRYEVSGR